MSRSARNRLVYWSTPAVCVLAGIAFLVAASISGHPVFGTVLLGIMLAFGAGLLLAGRRSETVRGLLDHRDERIVGIDLRATAVAGFAMILATLVGAFVELARGHSGEPYVWLDAVGGLVYIGTVLVLRLRA